MPLRGAIGPGETARVTTFAPSMRSTAKRGTPSPITIWNVGHQRRELVEGDDDLVRQGRGRA